MRAARIGVTTYRGANKYGMPIAAAAQAYIDALVQAGAAPLLIPLGLSEAQLDSLLDGLDGVLFTGGGDIHPERYTAEMDDWVKDVDEERDRVELYLLQRALERQTPLMGICRGFQLINVGLGGSLYTDIHVQHAGALKHDYYPNLPRDLLAHNVRLEPGSRLGSILGQAEVEVNSLHHQGVRSLAQGLTPVGYAPDGIVEAFEVPGQPFALAVQWHPEWLQAHAHGRALFKAFVQASVSAG